MVDSVCLLMEEWVGTNMRGRILGGKEGRCMN